MSRYESGHLLANPIQNTRYETQLAASPDAIREALAALRSWMAAAGAPESLLSRAELVMAEALNNIAEHAYAARGSESIRLRAFLSATRLCVTVSDTGGPFPAGAPPTARLPDPSVPDHALPEGGFGWFLIHDQTDSLKYTRRNGANHLRLIFRRDRVT